MRQVYMLFQFGAPQSIEPITRLAWRGWELAHGGYTVYADNVVGNHRVIKDLCRLLDSGQEYQSGYKNALMLKARLEADFPEEEVEVIAVAAPQHMRSALRDLRMAGLLKAKADKVILTYPAI